MNNTTLDNIQFPVFKLRQYNKVEVLDGIVSVHTHWKSYVLDNRNLAGKTLGERRTKITIGELYPFKQVYKTPRELVLQSKTGDTYADNSGKLFQYKKSNLCAVVCFEVKNIVVANSRAILHLVDFPTPMVVPYTSYDPDCKFVCIVKYGDYYILYSMEKERIATFKKRL
jgi:hypothetical protein